MEREGWIDESCSALKPVRTLLYDSVEVLIVSQRTGNAAPDSPLVWRYINLAKFLDLLQTSELHFTRLDRLDDPYEIALSKAVSARMAECDREANQHTYVNCWYEGQYESAAMWSIYSKEGGVAIQSSRTWLDSALRFPGDAPEGVSGTAVGPVEYLNQEAIGELLRTFGRGVQTRTDSHFSKRVSLSHEKETRLAMGLRGDIKGPPPHLRLKVNLEKLIDRIYVSPAAQPWVSQVVRREVEKYGLEKEVIHSDLLRPSPG